MSSNVPQSGHGASPFTGPNQVLVSNSLNGERTVLDLNSVPAGHVVGRTATGLGAFAPSSGGLPAADGSVSAPSIAFASDLDTGFFKLADGIMAGATNGQLGFRYGGASQTTTLGTEALEARTGGNGGTAVGHNAGLLIGNASGVTALGSNANATLTDATASTAVGATTIAGPNSTALGFEAEALGDGGTSIGAGSTATGNQAIAIGRLVQAVDPQSIAIGGSGSTTTTATGDGSIMIGIGAGATGMGAGNVGIGRNVLNGTMTNSPTGIVAIGDGALTSNLGVAACNTVAVGAGALAAMTGASSHSNTALGNQAGAACATGNNNVFLGNNAGSSASILTNAVCIGSNAQCGATTGNSGVVIGSGAGNTSMGRNIAIGFRALDGTTVSTAGCVAIGQDALGGAISNVNAQSTAVGDLALSVMAAGTTNTGIGFGAGVAVSSGSGNTLVGANAGAAVSSGSNTTIVGAGAKSSSTASGNTVVGQNAGATAMGANNTAVGLGALDASTVAVTECVAVGANALGGAHVTATAITSVAVGFNALVSQTNATGSTAVGHAAGSGITAGGNDNTCIGRSAGLAITTGGSNTFLGAATNGSALLNSQTCLGAGTSTTAAGAIAIGRNAAGTSAVGAVADGLAFPTSLATVVPGLAVQFNAGAMGPTTSSIRYKKDVALAPLTADVSGELKSFDNIRVVEYDSKIDGDNNRYLGIIAEELVDLVHPSLIPRDVEGNPVGISYDRLVCVAIQEIQLLRRRVAALEGAPLPALGEYTPVKASDLYDDDQIDDETLTTQKQQYKARARQLKLDRVVERIEKNPSKETAILNKLNKATRDVVRKAMEDKATADAAREAALAQAEAQAEAASKSARLDALARKKMAANVDLETVGPKMKARIEALLEKDRLALEVATAARLEAEEAANASRIAAEEEERRLEEEAEHDE
jgi:hypothetical protein